VYDYLADRQDVRICANDLANILSEFYDILVRNEAADGLGYPNSWWRDKVA